MFFGKTKEQRITTVIVLFLIIVVCIIVYNVQNQKEPVAVDGDAEISVHIIDVGQGNAAFIDNGDKDILIDAGDAPTTDEVLDYLDEMDVESIEYMFLTHPHEDHIAASDEILEKYDVAKVVIPNAETDTTCYSVMMEAIEESNAELVYACEGAEFDIGDIHIDIYSPGKDAEYSNLNLYSFIMRVEYEDTDFLFTGDAEYENEKYVLKKYKKELDCDFLCVGHHGSSTSSNKKFLKAVTPEIAVISVGEGNQYDHPHAEVLRLLDEYAGKYYRTDRNGDVVIFSDGERVWTDE